MSIELPKDAEGRDIPLDTKRLYNADGVPVSIRAFRYNPNERFWRVERLDGLGTPNTTELRLTPPDSWEKLEEDVGKILNHPEKIVCAYFNRERKDCDGCKLENCEGSCSYACLEDIMTRIHELRGDN